MVNKIKLNNKKGFEMDVLAWLLIGVALLVILVIGVMILSGKGNNTIEFIKNMFRFSRR